MNKILIGLGVAAALSMAGCGSLSQVDANGHSDDPVFPHADDVRLETGTYPNLENLRKITAGVTRDQLYDLIGRPHFSEGFRVREWDYLFHFNTAQGPRTCQYKVLFDKDLIGREFHWAPADCADILGGDGKPAPSVQTFSLSGDVSFAFASATLSTAGMSQIRQIMDSLRQASGVQQITVSGHTDRIGSQESNLRLSRQRAESVRQALVVAGIPASRVRAQGLGESQPLVQCDQQDRNALIACLAPNRRVEIVVEAQR